MEAMHGRGLVLMKTEMEEFSDVMGLIINRRRRNLGER